jgi:type II secretory pathway predicted ATPase ExeA
MGSNTPKKKLGKLRQQRDTKFDEIVSCLSRELYASSDTEAHHNHLVEEAEELTDNWAAADSNHRSLELSTALQILLNEHQEICRQILEIIDTESSDE